MLAAPAVTPATTPAGFTVAIAGALVPHVPPDVVFVSVIACPVHTTDGPVLGGSAAFTETTAVRMQPLAEVYVITEVPVDRPVTSPVDVATVATPTSELAQVPPPYTDERVEVLPTHSDSEPVIAAGRACTTTALKDWQPLVVVYLKLVLPPTKLVKTPDAAPIEPTVVLLLTHVPPDGRAVAVCVIAAQTGVATDMVGVALTVTTRDT